MYCRQPPSAKYSRTKNWVRVEVQRSARLLAEDDLLHHRRRRHRPAEADPGGEDLREGAEVDDEVAAVELVERRQRLAAVAQQPVGVVLDDEQLVQAGQLDQPPPPLERQRHPGRVLEARHRVDELRPLARRPASSASSCFEQRRSASRPRRISTWMHVGLVAAEDRHRAGVGRRLADHHVAGVDQRLADQVDRLLAAGGDDHVVGVGQHPLGAHHLDDAVLGLLEALGRPVLERLGRRLLGDPRHLRGEALRREGRGVRQAAGQRDHFGPGRDRHQVAHRRGAHHAWSARRRGRRSARGRGCSVWARRRCGGGGTSVMHRSVADRRPGAGEVRFSHVDFLTELGIGIAIGMLAGTTGTHGSARGRMTLLAAVDRPRRRLPDRRGARRAARRDRRGGRLPGDQRPRLRRQPPRGQWRWRARLHRRPGGAGSRRDRPAGPGR